MRLARRDLGGRAELRRRVPRERGRGRRRGELHRATELEHDEARDVGDLARHAARDPGDEREGAALARLEDDILDTVHAEGRWRADDPRLHVEVEPLLAGIGGIGAEEAGAGALEDEVARGRLRPDVPPGGLVRRPFTLSGPPV